MVSLRYGTWDFQNQTVTQVAKRALIRYFTALSGLDSNCQYRRSLLHLEYHTIIDLSSYGVPTSWYCGRR
jgi:hypothetical protein